MIRTTHGKGGFQFDPTSSDGTHVPTLKQIVEESDTPAGRAFDFGIQALIIISLITYSIETLPGLSESSQRTLRIAEQVTVALFSIEYIIRVFVAKPKLAYVASFYGLVDLAAILPYYVGVGIDLRSVRAFRLLRLFRLFKLARYSAAVRRMHVALRIAKEEIILFLCATAILLFLAAVGIHYFESEEQPEAFGSVFHCLWWAVATLTTVGYGDVYPVTVGGRIFTFFILVLGLGVISVPAGLVASALSKARRLEDEGKVALTGDRDPEV